eukprot:12443122-Alexandrium_andersonii.AAC.1
MAKKERWKHDQDCSSSRKQNQRSVTAVRAKLFCTSGVGGSVGVFRRCWCGRRVVIGVALLSLA